MKKKRLVFTLLYDKGYFCLSRNFRLQAVGNFDWLLRNCSFDKMLFALDEVCIIDCTRDIRDNRDDFFGCVERLNSLSFAPVSVGGWIRSAQDAEKSFASGADKLIINTALFDNTDLISELRDRYGSQSIIASLDVDESGTCLKSQGRISTDLSISSAIKLVEKLGVGELLINSIPKDGTGTGLDMHLIRSVRSSTSLPIIFTGGIGKPEHLIEGYVDGGVMGITTSNLLNFVGNSILKTRESLYNNGVDLPVWPLPF